MLIYFVEKDRIKGKPKHQKKIHRKGDGKGTN